MKHIFTLVFLLSTMVSLSAQRIYVVSAGICKYKNVNRLRNAENDARAIAKIYRTHTPNVTLLLGAQATHDRILQTMRTVFSQAKENDIVVFFFSGHGAKGGLCAYDSKRNTLVTYKEIQAVMKSCCSNNKQMLIDACYSGGLRSSSDPAANTVFNDANVMLFLSSRTNEISRENIYGSNGYFTQYLLKALKGGADANSDRIVTARELFDFVSSNVVRATAQNQHPVMWGRFSNDMHVINWNLKK